uniref:hypothetical protein n=1 Tax=Pedobacter sp. TaxID=1411316 RepID=UPI0015973124|nr:hypothetical protein [Pedobacter sp.]QJS06236.1 hypothetical protein [Pedobacter sp.]
MEKDIKSITALIRKERMAENITGQEVLKKVEPESLSPPDEDVPLMDFKGSELPVILEHIKGFKVNGQKKMLIRIDDKHNHVLSHVKQGLGFDVTQFINFLIETFVNERPEIKTLIKNSLKNSLKDL